LGVRVLCRQMIGDDSTVDNSSKLIDRLNMLIMLIMLNKVNILDKLIKIIRLIKLDNLHKLNIDNLNLIIIKINMTYNNPITTFIIPLNNVIPKGGSFPVTFAGSLLTNWAFALFAAR